MKSIKSIISAWPLILALLMFGTAIYGIANGLNPNSWWCLYQIYKNPNGTYEVWWSCRTRYCDKSGLTYDEAKAYQIKECKDLESFMLQNPAGKRVK